MTEAGQSPTSFVKERPDAPDSFFEAEAAGLRWLADAGGARIARVIAVAPGRIELERIAPARPTSEAATRFGAALARTHAAGAAAFGSPPQGYDGQLFIGSRPMRTAHATTWGEFYARDRVLPFLEIALGVGGVTTAQARVVREACALIARGAFDDDDPPARLHGDLWAGNVLWSSHGVVLIDPAAHGGHAETDLAMLGLFGCPYLSEILRAYETEHPLRPGWQARIPLHQLHPLAVHAAGHGASYGYALHDAARAVLALA